MMQYFIVYGRIPAEDKITVFYCIAETPSGAARRAEKISLMTSRRLCFPFHARTISSPIPPRFALAVVENQS